MNCFSVGLLQELQNPQGFRVIGSLFFIFAQGLQKTLTNWPKVAAAAAASATAVASAADFII